MKSLPLAVAVLLLFAVPASADPLAAPEDLTAQRVAEGVFLAWTGLPDASGYIVYRNGAAIGNTSGESFTAGLAEHLQGSRWLRKSDSARRGPRQEAPPDG